MDRLLLSTLSILIMGLSILDVSLSQSMVAMYTCYIIVGFAERLYVSNQIFYTDSFFAHSKFMIVRLSCAKAMLVAAESGIPIFVTSTITAHLGYENLGIVVLFIENFQ